MASITLVYHRPPDRLDHYQQEILHDSPTLLVTQHQVTLRTPLVIGGQVVLDTGHTAIWSILMGQHYDIGCMYDGEGRFTGYYCDMIEPPVRRDCHVSITDLFLDLWVERNGRFTVLDADELEEARRRRWISDSRARQAQETLDYLIQKVQAGDFPPEPVRQITRSKSGEFLTLEGAQHVARSW